MENREELLDVLKNIQHLVISTVGKNSRPEGATVGFANNEKFEVIFGTDINTRKSQNIAINPNVALTFNGHELTIQYEGTASRLEGAELFDFQKMFFEKMPSLEKYKELPNQVYYKVTPQWIRYTDHSSNPGKISEIKF